MTRTLSFLIVAATVTAITPEGHTEMQKKEFLQPKNLRCEYLVNPLGIDVSQPRLSWIVVSDGRGKKQTAYRILVASSKDRLTEKKADLWDSGKISSSRTTFIRYEGKPLHSRQFCYWKVRVWDEQDQPSKWSRPAFWSMGLLDENDWNAKWIGAKVPETRQGKPLPAQMLRKEFSLESPVKRAMVYVTALGLYELRINGNRVGDTLLAPEWTDYNRRVQYQTYDVTEMLRNGTNAIGAHLGDGWYAGRIGLANIVPKGKVRGIYGPRPRLLVQLEIETEDGETVAVVTDKTWKVTEEGPIRTADLLDGEVYDARREMPGWDRPGFDDSSWQPVVARKKLGGRLVAQPNEPIRVFKELKPIWVTEPLPGVYVFDLGQNMVGWCRIKLKGRAGQTIRLRHAEVLNPDGTLYRDNLRIPEKGPWGARQEDEYTFGADGEAVWEPHFTFHGFRYVELTGPEEKPDRNAVTGVAFCSSFPETGSFECSSKLLNQLNSNILWGQRGNMLSVPTDCPQRDERLGWMGDAQVFAPAACYNMDMGAFFTKWLRDVRDAQADDGRFPDFAPHPFDPNTRFSGVPAWGDAGVIVPWVVYERYGDTDVLEENFESSKRWIDYISRKNPNFIWENSRGNDYGDWLNGDTLIREGWPREGGQVPKTVFATLYFGYSSRLVARMAEVLGRSEEAEKYGDLADKIKEAFIERFVDGEGRIEGDTQAGYALALGFDMLPNNLRSKAIRHMVEAVEKYDRHISTGFLSTIQLMHQLTAGGYNDIAYQLINNKTFPSWGYSIEQGATTIWERWDGYVEGRGFQDPGMNSFNHYAFGSVGDWMWRHIIGIGTEDSGFEKIHIQPRPGGGLTWAKGTYRSIHGPITVDWKEKKDRLEVTIEIPANTTATVVLPAEDPSKITEGGKPVTASDTIGIVGSKKRKGETTFRIGSGKYRFTVSR